MLNRVMGLLLIAFSAYLLVSCRQPPPIVIDRVMIRVEPRDWPIFTDDLDPVSLFRAIEQSRVYLKRLKPQQLFQYGPDTYSAAYLLNSLGVFERCFREKGPGLALNQVLATDFILYKSIGRDGDGQVLVTGYYEPLLNGALQRTEAFKWPIYDRPDDLIEADLSQFLDESAGKKIYGRVEGRFFKPYFTRREIDRRGVLTDRGLELVWVDDPIGLFFLHVQGSGRVKLPDGRIMRVGYAGTNGRPYRSLGQKMIAENLVSSEEMSLPAIQAWLKAHPEQAADLLDHNESYIFFRELKGDPVGNINVPLTPGRSAALDQQIFPKGALAWISTTLPRIKPDQSVERSPLSRFLLVQDTGGAIKGPGRLDLFFGPGPEAEAIAGRMKEIGRLYFLVLKPAGGVKVN